MDLELKHITPYLPYGLQMAYRVKGGVFEPKGILQTVSFFADDTHQERLTLQGMDSEHIWMFKPILKPISIFGDSDDLRKVHEFIGIGKWCPAYDEYFKVWFNAAQNIENLILQAPQEIFNYFLSNHYDVFSLIPKGLAVEKSKIEK